MSRSINFTSGPECAQNNPYFRVQTIVPTRYVYEYLEELVLSEYGILPKKGKGYNFSFQDFPQLADLFNVVGIAGDITLTFTEDLVILEIIATSVSRVHSGGLYSYVDGVSVTDLFLANRGRGYNQSLVDVLSLNEIINVTKAKGTSISTTDQLSIDDLFVYQLVSTGNLNFLEGLIAAEVFNAYRTNGYNFTFSDVVNAADTYTMIGKATGSMLSYMEMLMIAEQFSYQKTKGSNLTYNDIVTVSEVFGSYIQRYDGSACNIYVDRVEADGGEVIDETGVCQAFTYFTTRATSGYQYSYSESMSLSDVFDLVGVAKQRNASFIDTISVADTATQTPAYKNKLYIEDNLSLSDLFNVYRQANISLSLFDSVTLIDSQDRQVTFTGKYNLSMMDTVLAAEEFVSTKTRKTNLSFLDFVSTLDQLGLAGTATRNLIFNDSIALGDQEAEYVQRYSGSACEKYVDRVEGDGGEVVDAIGVCQALSYFNFPLTTGYKLNFTESLSIMTFEAVVSGVRKTYNFAFIDSVETEDEFTDRRSRNIFLNFTEILDLAASN